MADVSAIILAGGRGSRLAGAKKALLDVGGQRIIERVLAAVRPLAGELVIVDNDESLAGFPGARVVPDSETGAGALVALSSGLGAARGELCIVVGSDMPFLSTAVLQMLVGLADGHDVVVPLVGGQLDPLHAVYRRETCLRAILRVLSRNDKRLTSYLGEMRLRKVSADEVRALDPELLTLMNVNTPDDLERARSWARDGSAPP